MRFGGFFGRGPGTRIAGAAVGIAGLAFIGLGTAGVGTVRGAASTSTSIVSITTTTCSQVKACGTLTVDNPVAGDVFVLELCGKNQGPGQFTCVGAPTYTITVTPQTAGSGDVSYSFCISTETVTYPILRVQVLSATGPTTITGQTTKGPSFMCSELPITSSSTTSESTSSLSSSTNSTTSTSTTSESTSSLSSSTNSTTSEGGGGGLGTTTSSESESTHSNASSNNLNGGAPGGTLATSTTTPNTGADAEFGTGLLLLTLGGGLVFGSTRLTRRKRR